MKKLMVVLAILCFCNVAQAAALDDLYKEYGQLMVQFEILQGRIQQVKGQIAQEINVSQQSQKLEPQK